MSHHACAANNTFFGFSNSSTEQRGQYRQTVISNKSSVLKGPNDLKILGKGSFHERRQQHLPQYPSDLHMQPIRQCLPTICPKATVLRAKHVKPNSTPASAPPTRALALGSTPAPAPAPASGKTRETKTTNSSGEMEKLKPHHTPPPPPLP
jgi:hypothetical protein